MLSRLNNFILSHYKITAFLLGSLSVQAMPPFYHWFVLLVCFPFLLHLIHHAQNKKQAFTSGYLFGFGFFAFGLAWVNNALLVNSAQTGWLIPIAFIASGGFLGLFIAFPALLCWFIKPIKGKYLAFCSWMVIFEWIRSWFLTGFPWNLWGTSLAFNLNLLQTASLWGVYGLSLLVLLVTSAPILWFEQKNKKNILFTLLITILTPFLLYLFGDYRLKAFAEDQPSDLIIRLVQPSISQTLKWSKDMKHDHFQKHIDLSAQQPSENLRMIIWGETASPYALDIDKDASQQIQNILSPQTYLTTGLIRYQNDYYDGWQPYNSALIINHQGVIEDFYDKTHLVPFGEYIPFQEWLPEFIHPITNIISHLYAGTGPKIIQLTDIPTFGIQICYEIIFPHHIINPKQKPEWLINLTNDSWYGISSGPYQHFVSAQLRAIEEGLTIVRSANNGISGLINRYGKVLNKLELNQEGVLDVQLPQQLTIPTFYNVWGNITILICCGILILLSYILARNNKK